LREITFRDFKTSKTAIPTISKALNFDFHEFEPFLRDEIYHKLKFRASKHAKKLADFKLLTLTFPEIDFT